MVDLFLKELKPKEESNSSQILDQLVAAAISIALIDLESYAWKALPLPVFSAKQNTKSA